MKLEVEDIDEKLDIILDNLAQIMEKLGIQESSDIPDEEINSEIDQPRSEKSKDDEDDEEDI